MKKTPYLIPPFHFATIEEGLYRGSYPTLKNFRFLRRLKLRTIISLIPYADDGNNLSKIYADTILEQPTKKKVYIEVESDDDVPPMTRIRKKIATKTKNSNFSKQGEAGVEDECNEGQEENGWDKDENNDEEEGENFIPLNISNYTFTDLEEFCRWESIFHVHYPVTKFDNDIQLTPSIAGKLLSIMINPESLPLYIHCLDGGHHTGLVVMCLRRLQNWDISSIFVEFCRYTKDEEILWEEKNFVESFSGEVEVGHRVPTWLWSGIPVSFHPSVHLKRAVRSDLHEHYGRFGKDYSEKSKNNRQRRKEDFITRKVWLNHALKGTSIINVPTNFSNEHTPSVNNNIYSEFYHSMNNFNSNSNNNNNISSGIGGGISSSSINNLSNNNSNHPFNNGADVSSSNLDFYIPVDELDSAHSSLLLEGLALEHRTITSTSSALRQQKNQP